jgi:uroporphyrinogen-III synthase
VIPETRRHSGLAVDSSLEARKIVITRAQHQATELARILRERNAEPLFYPCIDISLPEDTGPLDRALKDAAGGQFDWIVITSANTVRSLSLRLAALDLTLAGQRFAAIGPKTAAAIVEGLDVNVDIIAEEYIAESLAKKFRGQAGRNILLPQSAIARPVLADRLQSAGAQVTVIEAYDVVIGQGGDDILSLLSDKQVDAVTFTSASTARYFLRRLEADGADRSYLAGVCLVAIGPVTARAMESIGLNVDVLPSQYTLASMVSAMETYFENKNNIRDKE